MRENLHEIDRLFRSAIGDKQELPPAHIWEQLQKKLEVEKVVYIEAGYNNLKRVCIALVMIVFGFNFYEVNSPGSITDKPTSKKLNFNPDASGIHSAENFMLPANVKEKTANNFSAGRGKGNFGVSIFSSGRASRQIIKHWQATRNHDADNRSIMQTDLAIGSIDNTDAYIKSSGTKNINHTPKEDPVSAWETGRVGNKVDEKKEKELSSKMILQPGIKSPAAYYNLPSQDKMNGVVTINAPDSIAILFTERAKNSGIDIKMAVRFSFTGYYSWDHNTNRLQAGQTGHREDDRNNIKEKEDHVAAYSVGLLIDYRLTDKWMIETGLQISKSMIKIAPKQAYAGRDHRGNIRYRYNCSSGFTYLDPKQGTAPAVGDSMLVSGSENSLQYLGVPLAFKYKLVNGRFSILPELGLNLNLLLNQKISIVETGNNPANRSVNKMEGLRPSYISGIIGLNGCYALNNRTAVVINPEFRLGITSINTNAPVKSYRQSFGLVAGIQIAL